MKNILVVWFFLLLSPYAIAQRNVILMIADDLGTDYCGFYEDHQDTVSLPHIRSLLSKGVRFTNGMSNPVCSATRAGILTGQYSFRTGVGNIVGGTGGSGALDTAEITIPKLLKVFNPDIAKACIGKWHLHTGQAANLLNPNRMGYDHFSGPFIGQLPSYTNWAKVTNGISTTVTNYATTENVNDASAWIKAQNPSNPFFLWLAFNAPHAPYHLPPAELHSYTSLSGTQMDIVQHPVPYFKASLEALDHEIGRLLDSLQTYNKLDSTDFIFIGDNGNTIQTAQIENTDQAKGTIYQYGVHIPFIIAGPSVVSPGRVSNALVNTADLFATILEMFAYTNWQSQIPANKPVDSKSILPILKNQSTDIRPWAFTEIFKNIPDSLDGKAMRTMNYKLLKFDYGAEAFYNLNTDPLELTNLLTGILSPVQLTNYTLLCNQMANLTSSTNNCQLPLATVAKTMIKLPDTGQTNSYTNTNGEDADYTAIAPSLIVNSNGTVVDLVTGLMWQQADGGEMTIENATTYCDTLTIGGYTDWRLPNAHEAFSIVNHQNDNSALDTTIFTASAAEYWWTSDVDASNANKIWVIDASGGIFNLSKTETIGAGGSKRFQVRATRNIATPTTLANQFNNSNGTITDNVTGLIWQQVPNAAALTWEQALAYAENLSLGDATDWRLPNIKELQSISNTAFCSPAIDSNFFGTIGVHNYWSSTTLPNQITKAWYLDTQYGTTAYDLKTMSNYVICVKGLPTNCTITPTVSGMATVCNSVNSTYTAPVIAGATYAWIVTGGTIISGQGTNTIQVEWNDNTTGIVKVIQVNP